MLLSIFKNSKRDILTCKIGTFKPQFRIKHNLTIVLFLGFISAPTGLLMSAQAGFDMGLSDIIMIISLPILVFLGLFPFMVYWDSFCKKVVVYKDGIGTVDPRGSRVQISWEDIRQIRYDKDLFQEQFTILTNDGNIEGVIPFPLKETNSFIDALTTILDDEHALVQNLKSKI